MRGALPISAGVNKKPGNKNNRKAVMRSVSSCYGSLLVRCELCLLLFLPLALGLNAQHLTREFQGDQQRLNLVLDRQYPLTDNLFMMGEINSASLNREGRLAVASLDAPGVVLYDAEGTQIRQVGSLGRGPGEYVSPGIVRLVGTNLFIWDSQELKFLKYDADKNTPLLEIKDFRWAIKDFAIVGDDLFFYNSGRLQGPYIEQYDIRKNEYGQRFGERSQKHTLLMSMREAGGMGL